MIFPLRTGIIKSRFHSFTHHNLTFWWFLDFRSPGTPYLLILFYQNASKIPRKYGDILGKDYFCKYGHPKMWKLSKVYVPCFRFLDLWVYQIYIIFYEDVYFTKMRIENDKFSIIKSTKAWMWISYLSKTTKYKFGKSSNFMYF